MRLKDSLDVMEQRLIGAENRSVVISPLVCNNIGPQKKALRAFSDSFMTLSINRGTLLNETLRWVFVNLENLCLSALL